MSTSPYSLDLRKKVIEFLESGNTQRSAAEIFNLSKTTVSNWYLRYQKEGHYAPRKRLGAKPRIKVSELTEYVETHPNATLSEIGKVFQIKPPSVHYWLKKLKFKYKKKTSLIKKQAKKNETNTRIL